jgi:hypothetical protein
MLNLAAALHENHVNSVKGLRTALQSSRSSVREILQTNRIHQTYILNGGREGPLGFPASEMQFSGGTASRQYRGGELHVLGDGSTNGLITLKCSITFIGFRCVKESTSDQLSPTDEPYFVIGVDTGNGIPQVAKFAFENITTGSEEGVGAFVSTDAPPNPTAIRAFAYERDLGDPDETAKKVQDVLVTIAKAAQAAAGASGADAADGPGMGTSAVAGGVAGYLAGPIGALVAVGIVKALDLGDDFIGQQAKLINTRPEKVGTPPPLGQFAGNDFNVKLDIDGGDEGHYELFFDAVTTKHTEVTEGS